MNFLRRSTLLAASAISVTLVLSSGCAMTSNLAPAPSSYAVGAVQGKIMGGETPVAGSQVTLWETDPGNTGYGKTAKVLAGPVTSSNPGGNFSFTTGYTCDTGQFLYVTATGGDVTNGSASPIINNNLVLVSVLGSCSNFGNATAQGKTTLVVNELTTIAAAYATGSFATVNANGSVGTQQVYIGAPANNNVATGTCTGAGSAMACTAAGLAHAFTNATNLVDSVHFDGTFPLGAATANQTVPSNSLGSVPQADVNMLANIVAYCTNSAGGFASASGGGSDGTNCGTFFSDAKPALCTSASCAPLDTFTAAIDMGKSFSHNIAALYAFASSTGPFQPTLTTVPQNLSLAITYSGAISAFSAPWAIALDANDDIYVYSVDATTPTVANIAAMSAGGTALWYDGSLPYCYPGFIATDTIGNVFISNHATSTNTCQGVTGNFGIFGYSQSSNGTPTTSFTATSQLGNQSQTEGLAVDQYNDVWFSRGSTTCTLCLFEIPYSSGGVAGGTYTNAVTQANTTVDTNTVTNPNQIVIDQTQNVWYSTIGTSGGTTGTSGTPAGTPPLAEQLFVLPNTNAANYSTAGKPTYSTTTGYNYTGPSSAGYGYSFSLVIDSTNHAWDTASQASSSVSGGLTSYTETANFQQMTTPTTGGVISGAPTVTGASTTYATETKMYQTEFDGQGQLFYAYYSSTGELYYITNPLGTSVTGGVAPLNKGLVPCYAPLGAPTCSGAVIANPRGLVIDSSGAVWASGTGTVATGTGNGNVVQIFGAAYPTWPQLSYAHFGVEPQ